MLFAGLQEVHKQTQPGAQTGSRHGAIAEKHYKDHFFVCFPVVWLLNHICILLYLLYYILFL